VEPGAAAWVPSSSTGQAGNPKLGHWGSIGQQRAGSCAGHGGRSQRCRWPRRGGGDGWGSQAGSEATLPQGSAPSGFAFPSGCRVQLCWPRPRPAPVGRPCRIELLCTVSFLDSGARSCQRVPMRARCRWLAAAWSGPAAAPCQSTAQLGRTGIGHAAGWLLPPAGSSRATRSPARSCRDTCLQAVAPRPGTVTPRSFQQWRGLFGVAIGSGTCRSRDPPSRWGRIAVRCWEKRFAPKRSRIWACGGAGIGDS